MDKSTMFEEVSIQEEAILKRCAVDYIKMEGLESIDNLYPLSNRCLAEPLALFVTEHNYPQTA